jgi:ubiquitin-like 1-activating enzyme E1 B
MSKAIFSDEEMGRISSSRVLVVGAGGIGCEILKNLVYSGVKYVEIIGA